MKLVKITTTVPRDELLSNIKNHQLVNNGVVFDEKIGRPTMKVKERGNRLRITCELVDRATKDNNFLVGTYFTGKLTERGGVTTLSGVILTAPIYHLILFGLFVAFIVMCIQKGGFSVLPVFLVAFDFIMFNTEFKKQGIIKRYLYRATRITEKANKR